MAFGFIGDIVEQVGEAILPRGTRGATISSALGFSPQFGANLTADIASGQKGQEAVSTPTVSQDPSTAPESSYSGGGLIYAPTFTQQPAVRTAGFTPRLPSPTGRDIATGVGLGEIMDIIPDISISKFFGDSACMKKMPKLVGMTKDGCPTVTRKQQRVLRQMAQYMPLESVAYEAGVDTTTMARLISKSFPPRSKGISGAQLRNAKRVNNQILNMAGKLGYNVTPKTKAQLGCK
jgi:hypothetical protein